MPKCEHTLDENNVCTVCGRQIDPAREKLRHAVRFFYDAQKLRQQSMQRYQSKTAALDEADKEFAKKTAEGLHKVEKQALKEVERLLAPFSITPWLTEQRGVGPTMAGVIVSNLSIADFPTVSHVWSYFGLAVRHGQADRRRKGEKAHFNPWLKSKMVEVLADSFIKSNSPWREFYDNYKTRKQNQRVDTCMLCEGKGTYDKSKCSNCGGTGGPAPWGRSDAHRNRAAKRYMVKQFLAELWGRWRALEGLEARRPYKEEYLGRVHHEAP